MLSGRRALLSQASDMTSVSPGDGAGYAGGAQSQGFTSQTAEFFLQNYRLGKTLGIGSFGKVRGPPAC